MFSEDSTVGGEEVNNGGLSGGSEGPFGSVRGVYPGGRLSCVDMVVTRIF